MNRTIPLIAVLGLVATTGLAACTSNTDSTKVSSTFTVAMVADPGALDPQMSIVSGIFEMNFYAYDTILGITKDGTVVPQLAKSWTYDGSTAVFQINDGITCSDGSKLTAKTIADNVNWMEDMGNASPWLGAFLPAGITATADTAANTVTFKLAVPAPFLLSSISSVPIVCDAGLADRTKLAAGTVGSGPYVLTEAVPDDHYTYTLRDGYKWGPGGATNADKRQPKQLVVKIVPNESTAVNLLLSGEINLVTTVGPDAERAAAAGLPSVDVPANLGLTWYNHAEGHPTADPAVRLALTQAVNLDELAKAITSGTGSRATTLAVIPPTNCSYDSATGNVPSFSVAAAQSALEKAGYAKGANGMYAKDGQPLTVQFLYDSTQGTPGQAAAELAMQQWKAAGFTIEPQSLDTARISEVLFGTGAWDIAWEPINVGSPDQLVSYLSGPTLAEGGANLSSISNAGYDAAVAEALTKTGSDACASFQKAEVALFKAADFIPWAVRPNKIYYSKGFEYLYVGHSQVTALRVAG